MFGLLDTNVFYILRVDDKRGEGFCYITRVERSKGSLTHFSRTGSTTLFPHARLAAHAFRTLKKGKKELRSLRRKDKSGTLIKVEASYSEV